MLRCIKSISDLFSTYDGFVGVWPHRKSRKICINYREQDAVLRDVFPRYKLNAVSIAATSFF